MTSALGKVTNNMLSTLLSSKMNWSDAMAAYIVVTKVRTRNAEELKLYAEQSPKFLAGHAIKWHARFGHCEVLEGPEVESVGILEFPTLAEARAWYFSPVYQEASQHRFKGGDFSFLLVEGVPPG